jgi:hypothetical protein
VKGASLAPRAVHEHFSPVALAAHEAHGMSLLD